MAITKIHPIKSTLNLAIDYITKSEKTDEKILVSSFKCHPSTAHIQFMKTREDNDTKGTVLARHLIQSFLPGEVNPIKAHEIGMELCKKILKGDYEFVLATHIDRGHIHNHIIFNNVNYKTGKCYQSNKKTYHKIRYQSDELCKENKLSVIDEYYEAYKRKYKTAGKSWYEYDQNKKGADMAANKRYYWIKLKEEFFTDKRIKRLRRISGGDTYTIIYLKLLLLSLKDEGKLYYDGVESDFIKELALTIDETDDDVMVTVNYLINQGLLEVVTENDEYYLTEIPSLIGSETASTRRSRKSRELKMLQYNTNATHKQQKCNGEIEKDIEIDKEREGEIEKDKKSTPIFYGEFKNVRLSKEEYKNLKEKLNSHTEIMINKLSRYMKSSGKTYQNHYVTILNWYEEDKEKLRQKGLNKKMNYDVGESL